jgi:tetratricopeptide (TPR) repeat protein
VPRTYRVKKEQLPIMGFTIVVCVLFLCAGSACADTIDRAALDRVRDLTLKGLDRAYHLDFTNANGFFDEAIAVQPFHPRPYVSKASLFLWRYLLSKDDSDYTSFLSLADRAIETGEKYLDKFDDDADVLTSLGAIYGYRAFAHGRAKSYIKAAWDGKKSFDYFSDAVKLDKHNYDAYLGLGIFHYFAAFLPKPLQWIVSILGVTGDNNLGMKEIRLAAEKGIYTKVEAKFYLVQFLPWENGDFDSSENILKELIQQYPGNTLLQFTQAVWQIRRNDVGSAKQQLLELLQSNNNALPGVKTFARYKLAECCFRLDEYDQAREYYQTFLHDYHDENYIATSNYRIGLCYEITGQRHNALPYYRHAAEAERKFGDDAYAARKAGALLKSSLASTDILLLKAQNALKAGSYDWAFKLFYKLMDSSDISIEIRAEAIFGVGETFFEKGSYTDALQHYQSVLSLKTEMHERWLLPWSHYQSGQCYQKLGDDVSAQKEFEKVRDYDDYDFKNWLSFRTERELDKLKK